MIANDIRICQYRDAPAKEEIDDIARLMEASRAISQIIVMRLQEGSSLRIAGWSGSSWNNVVEHLSMAVRYLELEELEKK